MKQIYFFSVLVVVAVIGMSGASWAKSSDVRNTVSPSSGYLASSQWVSGKVETVETNGKYEYIRVNGIQYRTMPKVDIARRISRGKGAYNEVSATFQDVRENMDVMLRVQGFRIYQILIME